MRWEDIQANWEQLRESVKAKWAALTDDDLQKVAGRRDWLISILREKYGIARTDAELEIDEFPEICGVIADIGGSANDFETYVSVNYATPQRAVQPPQPPPVESPTATRNALLQQCMEFRGCRGSSGRSTRPTSVSTSPSGFLALVRSSCRSIASAFGPWTSTRSRSS